MSNLLKSLVYSPVELRFGTSGLRGLVTDMTDLECYINTAGFLRFLLTIHGIEAGETVYLAGDLRASTSRIASAVARAINDGGYKVINCGLIPTPAVALYGYMHSHPSIMVTGSHIPADRNGIKFNKRHDEVLKDDEAGIKLAVAQVRQELYAQDCDSSIFDSHGMLKSEVALPAIAPEAAQQYMERFLGTFDGDILKDKHIVLYEHSAVGRDIIHDLLERFGARVTSVGRSEQFIPIDSENVTPANQAYFRKLAQEHDDVFAIVSTDGDSDRPFVIDEDGQFHRGDVLGAIVANWLKADSCAFPVSSSDAVTSFLTAKGVTWEETKIGSPFVIAAMKAATAAGKSRVVGWEVNGGFMIGSPLEVNGNRLVPLPTRDAFTAIMIALVSAVESSRPISAIFADMPQRFTQAGLLDDFPVEVSKKMIARFAQDSAQVRSELEGYFRPGDGFSNVANINVVDGVRIVFTNGDVAHMRPSGNAPQLRIYSVADSQVRADKIVALALTQPDGIFRTIERSL